MIRILICGFILAIAPVAALAQDPLGAAGGGRGRGVADAGPPTKSTYIPLTGSANAVIVEPLTLNANSRFVIIHTHPEHANNINSNGMPLVKYGYRVMGVNYYGKEQLYYEFIPGLAAAIKAARAIPGVEKVILAAGSTGGVELSFYEDVAENGPKACQDDVRVYKCDGKGLDNLPKADGVMMLESAAGSPERTDGLNPAVGPHDWKVIHPELDMFSPANGYNPKTHAATYSADFLKKYFAAQAARSTDLINEAQARLAKIGKGEGNFKDDEPFVVTGAIGTGINGARALLADTRLMSHLHGQHMLLKADGSRPVIAYPLVMAPEASDAGNGLLYSYTMNTTVRSYLSFQALRLSPDYHMTEDNIYGVEWRSTPDSLEGNLQGVRVPTLILSGTCAPHIVYHEIAWDLSAARDKELVGVEGGDHGFNPCRPEYGDTSKRAYDYIDSWLNKPGRF